MLFNTFNVVKKVEVKATRVKQHSTIFNHIQQSSSTLNHILQSSSTIFNNIQQFIQCGCFISKFTTWLKQQ